jgi:sugar/nucleoside kinase (ribokinase family)
MPNRDEAALLTGTEPTCTELTRTDGARTAAAELSRAYDLAVVKLGGAGAVAARDGRVTVRVAGTPTAALDSTGAGDAFAGGFLAARLTGADDRTAVAAGCRAGAQAVGQVGGRPPTDHRGARTKSFSTVR